MFDVANRERANERLSEIPSLPNPKVMFTSRKNQSVKINEERKHPVAQRFGERGCRPRAVRRIAVANWAGRRAWLSDKEGGGGAVPLGCDPTVPAGDISLRDPNTLQQQMFIPKVRAPGDSKRLRYSR